MVSPHDDSIELVAERDRVHRALAIHGLESRL